MVRCSLGFVVVLSFVAAPAMAGVREIPVASGETLTVDLQTGGSVNVRGGDASAVRVSYTISARDAADVEVRVERTPGGVAVTSRAGQRNGRWGTSVDMELLVPRRFDLDLETAGGSLRIADVEGRLVGVTHGGELDLSRLAGEIDITTYGGNVRLTQATVDGRLSTRGGNVHVVDLDGFVDVSTSGGNVIFDGGRAPSRGCREVRITTLGGNIRAPSAPCGATLETMGGNVSIASAGEYVEAKTLGGNIDIGAVDGRVKATTLGGDIDVVMTGDPARGDRNVRLSSNAGDITLTLPPGISAEFDVTLAYTKNSSRDFAVRSDFPLELSESPGWDYSGASARRFVYGRGRVGDGRHKIKLETTNGDVRVQRGR